MQRELLGIGTSLLVFLYPSALVFAGRPFDGTDPGVVDRGMIEFKLGAFDYRRESNGVNWYAPKIGFNLGIAENWEFIVEGEWERARSAGNMAGDDALAIGLKHVLREGSLQGNSGFSVATELTLERLPGRSADTGVTVAGIIGNQWDWGALYFNMAAERNPERDEEIFLSVIWEGSSSGSMRPVAELSFAQDFHQSEAMGGLLGLIYEPKAGIAIDFAVRRSLGDEGSDTEIRLGATFELPGF